MNSAALSEPEKALNKAKIALMSDSKSVFFASVCLSMVHSFDDTIPTACTNGRWIKYNPDFFMKLTPAQRVGLIVHEVMHVAYNHMGRLLGRHMMKWNYATDFVINLQIIDAGFELPPGGLLDKQYAGMSAEAVYDKLPDPPENPEMVHFSLDGNEDLSDLEAHITDVLVRAATQAKASNASAGSIPGDIEIMLDKLLNPVLPTKVLLKRFVDSRAKEDYSWLKPNRRFFPNHYLPTLYSERLNHVAVAIDASGSVSDKEFMRFVSEVAGIFRSVRPRKITILVFDVGIRSVHTVRNVHEICALKLKGRGGTDIHEVIEWANTHKPKVMMVFTDGEFDFNDGVTSRTPFLWAINHPNPAFTFEAPFGKVVRYDA